MPRETPEGRLSRIEEMSARLDERTTSILREVDRLSRDVDAFGPLGGQVIEMLSDVRVVTEEFAALKGAIEAEWERERGEREQELKTLREERGLSLPVRVAIITGCFGLLGTIVLVLAQIASR